MYNLWPGSLLIFKMTTKEKDKDVRIGTVAYLDVWVRVGTRSVANQHRIALRVVARILCRWLNLQRPATVLSHVKLLTS